MRASHYTNKLIKELAVIKRAFNEGGVPAPPQASPRSGFVAPGTLSYLYTTLAHAARDASTLPNSNVAGGNALNVRTLGSQHTAQKQMQEAQLQNARAPQMVRRQMGTATGSPYGQQQPMTPRPYNRGTTHQRNIPVDWRF